MCGATELRWMIKIHSHLVMAWRSVVNRYENDFHQSVIIVVSEVKLFFACHLNPTPQFSILGIRSGTDSVNNTALPV